MELPSIPKLEDFLCSNDGYHVKAFHDSLKAWEAVCKEIIKLKKKEISSGKSL